MPDKNFNNFFLNQYKNINKNKKFKNDEKNSITKNNNITKNLKNSEKLTFQKLEKKDSEIFSKKKIAALYLIIIGKDNASKILKELNSEESEKLIKEIIKINKITNDDLNEVKKQFGKFDHENIEVIRGGKKFANELLQKVFGVKDGSKLLVKYLDEEDKKKNVITKLNELETIKIKNIISDESDNVNSILFGLMDSKRVADVLKIIPQMKSINILKRMSQNIEVSPEVIETIIDKIDQKINEIAPENTVEIKGKDKLIEILKYSSFENAENIIDKLEKVSPELAFELKDKIFTFDDLVKIPKKSLIFALKSFKDRDIAFMLKGANENLKNTIFGCVTKKRQSYIRDEIAYLGRVKKNDVDEKRKDFIEYLRDLEDKGKIILNPDNEIYIE